jgi:heat shock protein HslJ
MLRIVFIISIGLACTSCQHSVSLFDLRNDHMKSSVVFLGRGTEPSWTLKVSRTSISFRDQSGRIEDKIDPAYFSNGADGYMSDKISFSTNLIECFDGKLGRHFSHTVTVQVRGRTLRGCGGLAVTSQHDHLAKTNWRLERIDGRAPVGNAMTHIRFSQGRMIAFVGCNRLSRDYSHKNGEIVVGSLQTTNFACSDLEKQQERRFLEIFGQRARLEFDRIGQLVIQHPAGGTIIMIQTV